VVSGFYRKKKDAEQGMPKKCAFSLFEPQRQREHLGGEDQSRRQEVQQQEWIRHLLQQLEEARRHEEQLRRRLEQRRQEEPNRTEVLRQ
jgi:hypothetical protein